MNFRVPTLLAVLLAASTGCARNSAARVEFVPSEKSPPSDAMASNQTAPAEKGGKFSFPPDQGGKLLRELLGPGSQVSSDTRSRSEPRPRPVPVEVAHPELPTPLGQVELSRPPLNSRGTALLPPALPEGLPLAHFQADPTPAARQELRGGAPVRVPSPDVEQPPPLPLLGVLTADRIPVDDPTTAESARAALAAESPVRVHPVPFTPRHLPDPFENGQTIQLRTIPAEAVTPSSGPVRAPTP